MNNLSPKMQERLDKFRNKTSQAPSKSSTQTFGRATKGDFGDMTSQEEWDEEHKKSQKRK